MYSIWRVKCIFECIFRLLIGWLIQGDTNLWIFGVWCFYLNLQLLNLECGLSMITAYQSVFTVLWSVFVKWSQFADKLEKSFENVMFSLLLEIWSGCLVAQVISSVSQMFFLPAELAKEARNEVLTHWNGVLGPNQDIRYHIQSCDPVFFFLP